MVWYCAAAGCTNRFVKGGPYTFHSFPKKDEMRKIWEIKISRENFKPSNYSKLCSRHFSEECFDRGRFGGTWLKADAVPTIFDFPEELVPKDKKRKFKKIRIRNQKETVTTNEAESVDRGKSSETSLEADAFSTVSDSPAHLEEDDKEGKCPKSGIKNENETAALEMNEETSDRGKSGETLLRADVVPTLFVFPEYLKEIYNEKECSKSSLRNQNKTNALEINKDSSDGGKSGETSLKADALPTISDFPEHLEERDKERECPKSAIKNENESAALEVNEGIISTADEAVNNKTDTSPSPSKKRLRYIGDFKEEDIASPTKAKAFLTLVRKQYLNKCQQIKCLRQKEKRLCKRVASLQEALNKLKKRCPAMDDAPKSLRIKDERKGLQLVPK